MTAGVPGLPQFYNYPPYFTLQPVKDTREKQIKLWKELILQYCKQQKVFRVNLDEEFPLFVNQAIDRKLSNDAKVCFLGALVAEGRAEWLDKGHQKCLILWRRVEDWADIVLQFVCSLPSAQISNASCTLPLMTMVRDNAMENNVMTLEELRQGDDVRGTELEGVDMTILLRAVKLLESRGKAALFKGTTADDEGVKFFS
eukprot:SM000111S18779  [mRNA]  locus=s111:170626:172293:+ [translate_table: standard]